MELKKYQYGSNPETIIYLTELEALAANETTFERASLNLNGVKTELSMYVIANFPDGVSPELYNETAAKLNEYIEANGGSIDCTEEYLETNPLLKEVE